MFRIGEFSKFTRVSVKMLRHYDDLGLLHPARIDPLLPSLKVNLIFVTSWGELLLLFWLLIKEVNVEQWERRAVESARSSLFG